jgi:ElaB/YqjD/DUF883 family membrane-anchored ribosome-binding protein
VAGADDGESRLIPSDTEPALPSQGTLWRQPVMLPDVALPHLQGSLDMASTTDRIADRIGDTAGDARDQIRQLRDQVDSLMRERVTPMISDAAGRAQDAARQARSMAEDQAEAFSGRVKERPITAVLIAAAAGYLIGRLSR